MAPHEIVGIRPGDIGFDRGQGLFGWIIRHATNTPHAHTWVFIRDLGDGMWLTHEAGPIRVVQRERHVSTVGKVSRIWRDEQEQRAVISASIDLLGTWYAYGELLRIVAHYFWRQPWLPVLLALIGLVASIPALAVLGGALLLAGGLSGLPWDSTNTVICSNHVSQVVQKARPEYRKYFRFPTYMVWPGELSQVLNRAIWNDRAQTDAAD